MLLRTLCPREMRTTMAPFDVRTSGVDEVQPDVVVARFVDMTSANLPVAPVLVAEVASYWLLDPRGDGVVEVLVPARLLDGLRP